MLSDTPISFTVTFRGNSYQHSLPPESTLSALGAQLEELTSVSPYFQKLLHKGKNLLGSGTPDITLAQAGFKDGLKLQMLGTTPQEMTSLQSTESEQSRRDRILRERAMKTPTKLRSTGMSDTKQLEYRFHKLVPLAHLPDPSSSLALLTKLSEDPAVSHIMKKHRFSVGVLTELAPHEHPELLGLNVSSGQAIKLRLRTDIYDGFRLYKDVRKVLCHELTHNVWGPHDENFKELNSRLNREVAEYERSVTQGTHHLIDGDVYEPSSELEAEAQDDSPEERRQKILQATMARLRKEEEELEKSCGTDSART